MNVQSKVADRLVFWGALASGIGLAACTSGSNTDSSTVTVAGDVPIAYAMRANTVRINPLTANPFAPGGDLIIREKSSPSAPEHNITAQFTQGKGDVVDPSVSFDGKKIVFAMNCPASNTSTINGQPACTGHWNIWEYDMTNGGLTNGTFRRITSSSGDDVAPNYLPGGAGFVFASNRQTKSSVVSASNPQGQALGQSYKALDEYEREVVSNLHTMDLNGGNIQQISFNQSHDRNPVVRPDGTIMYSRWDHVGDRNRFTVFTTKPDGTGLFVLYGAHNSVNSFLHPRDMDPNGPNKGFIASDAMPLDRTQEGGALMFIDAANYSEQDTPANSTIPAQGGQTQPTTQALNFGTGLSLYGRITAPFPLRDGTNRVLLAYAPCEVSRSGVVVPCATLSAAEVARLSMQNRLIAAVQADPLQDNVPPSYAIYMFDPKAQTWLIVAAPPVGFMYDHPVPITATPEPIAQAPTSVDAVLASQPQPLGVLDVQSVYDTDGLGRMGDAILNLSAGSFDTRSCATPIAKTTPLDPLDTRPLVADLVKIKDPANAAYACAPARFVRIVRAVAPPSGMTGTRQAIGETEFEMQQVLGYAPIEPDGSLKLHVPADTPIGLQVVDSEGRAFQMHTNWIQVRPGERRTCDGCHSPRRGAALNSGTIVNSVPAAWLPTMAAAHQAGDTMAATRTRIDQTALTYSPDLVYTDGWANPAQARAPITIRYSGNTPAGNDLTTPAPTNGIINYPDHIQPIWDQHGCNSSSCHSASDPVGLNLLSTTAGTGRMASYESLLVGTPKLDASGKPVTQIQDGVLVVQRNPGLVIPTGGEGEAVGVARKSRLTEIMWAESLMTDAASQAVHPNPPAGAPNHATMLNAAEKRLIAEWMDLAAKYYNDPFNASSGVRAINGLSKDVFTAQIEPILMKTCAAYCHQGVGSNLTGGSAQTPPPGTSFVDNNLVLTGTADGDFNVVLTMISDACNPSSNLLLSKPSTIPHPTGATNQTVAVLPVGSADYNTISAWIQAGCTP